MRSFIVDGKEYRSICDFCTVNHVSYQKLRRLVRHYKRANQDPSIAAKWLLDGHIPVNEPKTWNYYHDIERKQERKLERDADISEKIDELF